MANNKEFPKTEVVFPKTETGKNLGENPTIAEPDGYGVATSHNNDDLDPHFQGTTVDVPVETKNAQGKIETHVEKRLAKRIVGWLITYNLDPNGTDFKLYEGVNRIGRDTKCEITIPRDFVSSVHAKILFQIERKPMLDEGGNFLRDENGEIKVEKVEKFQITDCESINGTLLNRLMQVPPNTYKPLEDGTIISVGDMDFIFRKVR